jgi:hypothetical protein
MFGKEELKEMLENGQFVRLTAEVMADEMRRQSRDADEFFFVGDEPPCWTYYLMAEPSAMRL